MEYSVPIIEGQGMGACLVRSPSAPSTVGTQWICGMVTQENTGIGIRFNLIKLKHQTVNLESAQLF